MTRYLFCVSLFPLQATRYLISFFPKRVMESHSANPVIARAQGKNGII